MTVDGIPSSVFGTFVIDLNDAVAVQSQGFTWKVHNLELDCAESRFIDPHRGPVIRGCLNQRDEFFICERCRFCPNTYGTCRQHLWEPLRRRIRTDVHATGTRRHAELVRNRVPTANENSVAQGCSIAVWHRMSRVRWVGGSTRRQPVACEETTSGEVAAASDQCSRTVI